MDPDVLAWTMEGSSDRSFFRDVNELRRILEPAAARLAAERADDAELDAIAASFAELEVAAAGEDVDAFVDPDIRFHELILGASHNELLEQVGNTLRAVFRALFSVQGRSIADRVYAVPLHGAIVDALRARDGAAAEAAMLGLIDNTAANLERELSARQQKRAQKLRAS
jgi:DNA-binding FadR family transcriptional regulator